MEDQRPERSSAEFPARPSHPPIALLVEESEIWGNVVSRYLSARGIDVTWMKHPEGALPFILDLEPDLILVDETIRHSESALVDRVARLGPDATSRSIILTEGPASPAPHRSGIPAIRKSDLFAIGNWLDGKVGIFPPSFDRAPRD